MTDFTLFLIGVVIGASSALTLAWWGLTRYLTRGDK